MNSYWRGNFHFTSSAGQKWCDGGMSKSHRDDQMSCRFLRSAQLCGTESHLTGGGEEMRGGSFYFHYTLQVKSRNVRTLLVHQIQLGERLTAARADDLSAVTPSLERNVLCVVSQPLHSPDTDKKHCVRELKEKLFLCYQSRFWGSVSPIHLQKAFCRGSHKACLMPSQRVDFNPQLSSLSRQFAFIQENVF